MDGTEFEFGKNIQLTCAVKLADVNALKNYCSHAEIFKQVIFKQLDSIQALGIFGSSRVTHTGDWIKVAEAQLEKLHSPIWDEETQNCTLVSDVQL